jgi:phosphoribosyl-ATP pyrophosphohydrolase/phosphoribosyl-AMP cyclohydrolase
VTVVAQDATTGTVLMVAHATRDALARTLATGEMHYTSRTRGLWHKGGTSGNTQSVVSLTADCDGDAILALVRPSGPACHTGAISCFGDTALGHDALAQLDATVAERGAHASASSSYTRRLLADRNLRLKKLGEEAVELSVACVDGDRSQATAEFADLFFHSLVALRAVGGSLLRRHCLHHAPASTVTQVDDVSLTRGGFLDPVDLASTLPSEHICAIVDNSVLWTIGSARSSLSSAFDVLPITARWFATAHSGRNCSSSEASRTNMRGFSLPGDVPPVSHAGCWGYARLRTPECDVSSGR